MSLQPSVDWDALKRPFDRAQISQVDKGFGKIDTVNHAHVTNRLNAAAPGWTHGFDRWVETQGKDGMPHLLAVIGWMEVAGIRRYEVGEVERPSTYGDEAKKAVSDFIKRAAMRFGVALDLWAKEELEASAETTDADSSPASGKQVPSEPKPPASAEGGPTPDIARPSGAPPNLSPSEDAPVPSGGDSSSAAPNAAGTEAGGARQELAGHGEGPAGTEGSPQPPTSRHDALWDQLVQFAGTKRKALNAVNTTMKASWTEPHIGDIPEDDIEHTLKAFMQREGVA
jgi:hypothetical protein